MIEPGEGFPRSRERRARPIAQVAWFAIAIALGWAVFAATVAFVYYFAQAFARVVAS